MRCKNCGSENRIERKTCNTCGAPLQVLSISEPSVGLDAFIGQEAIKDKLNFQVVLANKRATPVNHILICGSDAEGKIFLAKCLADEMRVSIKIAKGSDLKRRGDMAMILTNLHQGDIFAIEHIENVSQEVAAVLAPAMRDFILDMLIGKGPSARSLRLPLPRFTLFATVPQPASVNESLRDAFNSVLDFSSYDIASLVTLLYLGMINDKLQIDAAAAEEMARRANGSLSVVRKLARQVKEYAIVMDYDVITEKIVLEAFGLFTVDGEQTTRDRSGLAFEMICMELLRRRNFDVRTTRRTSDGGIDLIAWSNDPFVGGKYIVQCKDWTNPVGASVVRDLYGVVHSEDANKGILIAASTFTQQALDFANGKRLELINGSMLKFLGAQ